METGERVHLIGRTGTNRSRRALVRFAGVLAVFVSMMTLVRTPSSAREAPGVIGIIVDRRVVTADPGGGNARLTMELPGHTLIICVWQSGQCNPPMTINPGDDPDQFREQIRRRLTAAAVNTTDEPPTLSGLSEVLDSLYRKADAAVRDSVSALGTADPASSRLLVRIVARPDVRVSVITGPDLTRVAPSRACFVPAARAGGSLVGIRSPPPGIGDVLLALDLDGDRGWTDSAVRAVATLMGSDSGRVRYLGQHGIGCLTGQPQPLPPPGGAPLPACQGDLVIDGARPNLGCPSQAETLAATARPPVSQPAPPLASHSVPTPAPPVPRPAELPPQPPSSAPSSRAGASAPPAAVTSPLFRGTVVAVPVPRTANSADQLVWRDGGSDLTVTLRAVGTAKTIAKGKDLNLSGEPRGTYRIELLAEAGPGVCLPASVVVGRAELRGTRVDTGFDFTVIGKGLICAGDPPVVLPIGEMNLQ